MTFASRAGEKLEFAIGQFAIPVSGTVCADLGCSTGGFTDALLQHGAAKVYAVDTARGVLDWTLRNDPRVIVMEGANAMYVELPEAMDLVTIDVGWTPQIKIVPHALTLLKSGGNIISLLKPHYEADPRWLRGGTLPKEFHHEVIQKVSQELAKLGVKITRMIPSPIPGSRGKNQEYFLWIKK